MNPQRPTTYTSTRNDDSTSSSIRPRNRRLISYGDDNEADRGSFGGSELSATRRASPIPDAHPSRPHATATSLAVTARNGYDAQKNTRGQTTASGGFRLWESWSTISGIASTLLGSDVQSRNTNSMGGPNAAVWRRPSKNSKAGAHSPQWGPKSATEQTSIPGSHEERQALVQAKRREVLLLADTETALNTGNFRKRRDSDARRPDAVATQEQDTDVLVYVHKIKPEDTLAGVMIRYQCQPAVFRKVNRLWPNDNIQVRKRVLLPLEACSLRSKKTEPADRLSGDEVSSSVCQQPNPVGGTASPSLSPSPSLHTPPSLDPEYKHEYFASVPGFPESVEVARLSRRTLGFFPPSRRKSQSYLDIEPEPRSFSPKTSLDLIPRISQPSPLNPLSPSYPRTAPVLGRHRNSSTSTRPKSSFLSHLSGPGGVGSLRPVGPEHITQPGPAPDSLNKMFAHRLPNLAPPPSPSLRPSLPGRVRESFDSVHSTSSSMAGLENVGGAIEGWVRRVGGKLAGQAEPGEAWRRRNNGIGDLIELEGSSVGGDEEDDAMAFDDVDEGVLGARRGSQFDGLLPAEALAAKNRKTASGLGTATGTGVTITATEEALLRERFPPRPGARMVDALRRPGAA